MMSVMTRLSLRRDAARPAHVRGPLRTREPAGLIDPVNATARLEAFHSAELGAVDTTMDRLVVAISTDPVHLLVIAGPLTLTTADGTVSVCHSPGSPEALAALGGWVGRRIESVTVRPSGGLRIDCSVGRLSVEAGSDYEAWEIRGMDGGLLACLPGGQISLWRPTFGEVPAGR